MTEELMIECAKRGAQLYAETHPRPPDVNMIQAASMLRIAPQTVRKMVLRGDLPVNGRGMIPTHEIDRLLAVRSAT